MKKSLTCPKCEGRKIIHVPQLFGVDGERGTLVMLPVVLAYDGSFFTESTPVGHFEAFICAACGFTEHYAVGVDGFAATVAKSKLQSDVRIIDNEPKATLR